MNVELFSTAQTHFKGNLHTHSTISDGMRDPKEIADAYRKKGFDFLAFTEHYTFTWLQELNQPDFLILPGIEAGCSAPGPYQIHHVVGIGGADIQTEHFQNFDHSQLHGTTGAQTVVDTLQEQGYLSIYCHPVWSRQSFAEIAQLERFQAIEVYNHNCYLEDHTGHASYYWDAFLRQGTRIWAVATDDSHQKAEDFGGGWVVVNAPSLTVEAINQALLQGSFYSSNGPAIEAYGVKDGKVYVRCSPAVSIHFVAFERRGGSFHATGDRLLTEATHTLHGDEKYVRIEVVDERGRTAWSNPIFF